MVTVLFTILLKLVLLEFQDCLDPNCMLAIFLGLSIIYLPLVDNIIVLLEEKDCAVTLHTI